MQTLDFGLYAELAGAKVSLVLAGHVVGAAMFSICLDDFIAFYSGDYAGVSEYVLSACEYPFARPHVFVVEGTLGLNRSWNRLVRDDLLLRFVSQLVCCGKVLIPVSAVGGGCGMVSLFRS